VCDQRSDARSPPQGRPRRAFQIGHFKVFRVEKRMHFFYQSTFLVLAATTGLLEYLKAHGAPKPFSTNNSFLSFRNNYLLVYSLMMGATQSAPHCDKHCNSCVFGTIAGDTMLRYQLPLHVLGAVLVEYLNAHKAPKPYSTNNGFLTFREIQIYIYKTHNKPLRIQQHPASASTATLKNSTWTGQGQASRTE
jgi:hypothetical protein